MKELTLFKRTKKGKLLPVVQSTTWTPDDERQWKAWLRKQSTLHLPPLPPRINVTKAVPRTKLL